MQLYIDFTMKETVNIDERFEVWSQRTFISSVDIQLCGRTYWLYCDSHKIILLMVRSKLAAFSGFVVVSLV